MAQYQLSSEEISMLDIMKVFGEDDMARLIGHTDQKQTFGILFEAIRAGQRSTIIRSSLNPKQQAIWAAFVAREAALTYRYHEAAYEAAAKLVMDAWIDYPRPGTEQPYTPGHLNGNQHRREVCYELLPYAEKLRNKIEEGGQITQNQYWNYTIAILFNKLCWHYYELSNYTEASTCAERGLKICESAMKNMMVLAEHEKWLVLLSDMQQAYAVIASDLGNVQTAMIFGQRQTETAAAVAAYAPRAETTELARAYMVMGNILIMDYKFVTARSYFARAVPILKALRGYDKLQMYTILHGLGWIHLLKHEYQKAGEYLSEALFDREAAYGVDDIEGVQTGELLYALGTVFALQGKMRESLDHYRRGRRLLEAATGTSCHWSVAKMMYKLAGHYIRQHDWDRAFDLLIQCDEYYKTSRHFDGIRARIQYRLLYVYEGQDLRLHARKAWNLAFSIRKSLREDDPRGRNQLFGKDYDELVVAWCR